jgi:hypothetical protein
VRGTNTLAVALNHGGDTGDEYPHETLGPQRRRLRGAVEQDLANDGLEPAFCRGSENRISSATGEGRSLGLDGASFYPGQVISAPPQSQINLADGSRMRLEKGGEFEIEKCAEDHTSLTFTNTVRKMWNYVKHSLAGSETKFEVKTKRAVAGVRGTKFAIFYDAKKELRKVWGIEHMVYLKGRNGAKGMVLVNPGQVAVQQGKGAPHLVKR